MVIEFIAQIAASLSNRSCRNSPHNVVIGNVVCYNGTSGDHGAFADCYVGQNRASATYVGSVAYTHGATFSTKVGILWIML